MAEEEKNQGAAMAQQSPDLNLATLTLVRDPVTTRIIVTCGINF